MCRSADKSSTCWWICSGTGAWRCCSSAMIWRSCVTVSHRVLVFYLGRLIEIAPRDPLFAAPMHPYTRALHGRRPPPGQAPGPRSSRAEPSKSPLPAAWAGSVHFAIAAPMRASSAPDRCRASRGDQRGTFRGLPSLAGTAGLSKRAAPHRIFRYSWRTWCKEKTSAQATAWPTCATKSAASWPAVPSIWSAWATTSFRSTSAIPYAFGFRTPETMRLAMIENLRNSEGYVHQKGIFPAREAVVMQQQERGVRGVTRRRGVHRQRRERTHRSGACGRC